MVSRALPSIGLACLASMIIATTARADTFLVPEGSGPVTTLSRQVLLVRNGPDLITVDELVLSSQAPRAVWVRAFPLEPRLGRAPDNLFLQLQRNTIVSEPHNQAMRRNLFGPSLVTVLNKKLGDPPQLVPPLEEPPARRSLALGEVAFFSGRVQTSTSSRQMQLPEVMERWLTAQGIQVSDAQKTGFSAHLNRNWVLMLAVVEDSAPGLDTEARLGPIRFDVAQRGLVYPQLGVGPSTPVVTDFYTLAEGPMAMNLRETLWNTRPWELNPGPPPTLEATYSAALDPNSNFAAELTEQIGLNVSSPAHLVRARYRAAAEGGQDLEFHPSRERILIPSGTQRGSFFDLLLCVLLGLTPLIYTPESWFLIWLVNGAKERARREGSAWGVNLWAYFALVVAVFWVVSLEGPGRIAGLVPFVLGVGRLAWPYTERETPRVRVAFKAKKKA